MTRRAPIAIENLPARPHCAHCSKTLAPWTDDTRELQPYTDRDGAPRKRSVVIRRVFFTWRGYQIRHADHEAWFCTLRCARSFAEAAYRAGYRITRRKEAQA